MSVTLRESGVVGTRVNDGRARTWEALTSTWEAFTSAVGVANATVQAEIEWWLVGSVVAEVRHEGSQWVAIEYETGMFGEGDDPTQAVNDLVSSLDYLRRDLAGSGALTGELQQDLEALNRIFDR